MYSNISNTQNESPISPIEGANNFNEMNDDQILEGEQGTQKFKKKDPSLPFNWKHLTEKEQENIYLKAQEENRQLIKQSVLMEEKS